VLRIFVILLALLPRLAAAAPGFYGHLSDAIAENRARTQAYARMSGGRSRPISQALIATENASLPIAAYLEWYAQEFREAGIPVLELDFVDMGKAPKFSATLLPAIPESTPYLPIPRREWKREIDRLIATNDFAGLHATAERWVKELSAEPRFHVMVRHVLESTARIAWLAPQYERLAREKGLKSSPLWLSKRLLYLHAQSLWISDRLDSWAMPIQRAGVPILLNDVPPIDTRPTVPVTCAEKVGHR